jgi:hypothetical protein
VKRLDAATRNENQLLDASYLLQKLTNLCLLLWEGDNNFRSILERTPSESRAIALALECPLRSRSQNDRVK